MHMTAEVNRGAEVLGYPPPGVFVSAESKGVTRGVSVSADSKGLICTKIVQNARFHGSAESKGVSEQLRSFDSRWSLPSRLRASRVNRYTPVATGSMRNVLRAGEIFAPRDADDGRSSRLQEK